MVKDLCFEIIEACANECKFCSSNSCIDKKRIISFEDFILEDDSPIYTQIIRYVKRGIVSGIIQNGDEMLSRRALSALLGVNPNTIQKAYRLLEEEGIIRSRTGAKSCVEVDESQKEGIRMTLLSQDTASWVQAMRQMGVGKEQAIQLALQVWEDEEGCCK